MIPTTKTVEIYYLVDEFLKEYDAVIKSHSLEKGAPGRPHQILRSSLR